MKNKKLNVLPGNVKLTPKLKRLKSVDFIQYLKEYQIQLLNNVKRTQKW